MDWRAIKTEYITGNISYRKLAAKYGIPFSTLRNRAIEEQWYKQKEQKGNELVTRSIEKSVEKESTRLANNNDAYYRCVEKLFAKAEECIENTPVWSPNALKEMATTMKYLKECKGVRSDADMREQEARIKKLEQELNAEQKDTRVIVEIQSDAEGWSK